MQSARPGFISWVNHRLSRTLESYLTNYFIPYLTNIESSTTYLGMWKVK